MSKKVYIFLADGFEDIEGLQLWICCVVQE